MITAERARCILAEHGEHVSDEDAEAIVSLFYTIGRAELAHARALTAEQRAQALPERPGPAPRRSPGVTADRPPARHR